MDMLTLGQTRVQEELTSHINNPEHATIPCVIVAQKPDRLNQLGPGVTTCLLDFSLRTARQSKLANVSILYLTTGRHRAGKIKLCLMTMLDTGLYTILQSSAHKLVVSSAFHPEISWSFGPIGPRRTVEPFDYIIYDGYASDAVSTMKVILDLQVYWHARVPVIVAARVRGTLEELQDTCTTIEKECGAALNIIKMPFREQV